jgi:hypothetical protein
MGQKQIILGNGKQKGNDKGRSRFRSGMKKPRGIRMETA